MRWAEFWKNSGPSCRSEGFEKSDLSAAVSCGRLVSWIVMMDSSRTQDRRGCPWRWFAICTGRILTHQISNIFIISSNSDPWKIRGGLGPRELWRLAWNYNHQNKENCKPVINPRNLLWTRSSWVLDSPSSWVSCLFQKRFSLLSFYCCSQFDPKT